MFNSLKNDDLVESVDRLGGFHPFKSDVYIGPIKMAFVEKAASGAMGVALVIELDGREYEQTIYVTDKAGKNYFVDKNDKTKKQALPGFNVIDDLCLVATGEPLSAQDEHLEEKLVKVYDKDTKGRVPKSRPVITSLIGKTVAVAIFEILENKNQKEGDKYVPTAETRTVNEIEKVFDVESRLSVAEARHQRPAEFWDAWVKQNKDRVIDKRTIKDGMGGQGGSLGRPPAGNGNTQGAAPASGGAPKRSLFGAKNAA